MKDENRGVSEQSSICLSRMHRKCGTENTGIIVKFRPANVPQIQNAITPRVPVM